jgi:hypothetical protein
MKGALKAMPLLGVFLLIGIGCASSKIVPLPTHNAPAGKVVFQFTKKVAGPVDLSLDGVRVPVTPKGKNRKAKTLVITGLSAGAHRYFLSSPQDAMGPDQGTFEVNPKQGLRVYFLSQPLKAVLYGNPEPLPTPEGLPGVQAHME